MAGRQGIRDAASQQQGINQGLISQWQDRADPNGQFSNDLADASVAATNRSWGSTGTLGSARNANASAQQAQRVVAESTGNALQQLASVRDNLNAPADLLRNIGAEERVVVQDIINEDIKRFNYAELSPQQQVERIMSLMSVRAGIEQGDAADARGAADRKAAKRKSNISTAITLISMFSDERLKEDITKVGELESGVGIYDWDWNEAGEMLGEEGSQRGVIAQEVAQKIPGAVHEDPESGFLKVDPSQVYNDGGMVYRNEGGMMPMGEEPMAPQGTGIMSGEMPMEEPLDPMAMGGDDMAGMEATMGNGIMDGAMPEGMGIDHEAMESMSELDVIENQLQSAIQAGGLDITITRKTKSKPKGRK